MYLFRVTKLSPALSNQDVMQKNLIVRPHCHLSELTALCIGGRDLTEFSNLHLLLLA